MKKTTLLAVVLSGALAVGAFAHGDNNQQGMMNGQYQQNMQRGQGMGMMGGQQGMINRQYDGDYGCSGNGIMGGAMMGGQSRMGMMGGGMQMFSQLNLTNEQQYQLSILRDEMRLKMKKQIHNGQPMRQMGAFLKGDNFDKNAFKKQMKKQFERMLNIMADNMEKSFKILTKEQKNQLEANMK